VGSGVVETLLTLLIGYHRHCDVSWYQDIAIQLSEALVKPGSPQRCTAPSDGAQCTQDVIGLPV